MYNLENDVEGESESGNNNTSFKPCFNVLVPTGERHLPSLPQSPNTNSPPSELLPSLSLSDHLKSTTDGVNSTSPMISPRTRAWEKTTTTTKLIAPIGNVGGKFLSEKEKLFGQFHIVEGILISPGSDR
jgi:hypothetical protein